VRSAGVTARAIYDVGVVLAPWIVAAVLLGPPAPRIDTTDAGPRAGGQQLTRRADGGYEHTNRRAGFSATIHPDGRVSFRDHSIGGGSVKLFGIDLSGKAPNVPDASQPSNTLVRPGDLGSLGDDPLVKWGAYGPPPIMLTAGGKIAGISDVALSTRRASAKQGFLEDTAALREQLATKHRRDRERAAITTLEADLRAIWTASEPAAVRRERIFQRWDECAEPPAGDSSAEDRARGRVGDRARKRIESWIRANVPEGSADAFAASELREMNGRRRSRASFAPYVVPPEAPAAPMGPAPAGSPAPRKSPAPTDE
jgi:hypothetical protein